MASPIDRHYQRIILDQVIAERERQDAKWGEQNHTPTEWLSILMEEVGETAQAANKVWFDNQEASWLSYRQEMLQVAAVAIAAVECLDRQGRRLNPPKEG